MQVTYACFVEKIRAILDMSANVSGAHSMNAPKETASGLTIHFLHRRFKSAFLRKWAFFICERFVFNNS